MTAAPYPLLVRREMTLLRKAGLDPLAFSDEERHRMIDVFRDHERNAKYRGAPFRLTIAQWWSVWRDSGKWESRGTRGDDYCMCRVGDAGAYEVGNVYIDTKRENSRISWKSPKGKTALHAVVKAAGGSAAVGAATNVKAATVGHLMGKGRLPKSWIADGRIQKISDLTAGQYSPEQIIELAVA